MIRSERKIAMVFQHVKAEDEDQLDISFWLNKTVSERLSEVSRLRKNYFTWVDGFFPEKMEKVFQHRKL